MLERTAATLESCTGIHALPSATHSLRTRRTLHTGFWQHGAAAIDIHSPVLSMRTGDTDERACQSSSVPSASLAAEPLSASTFLLDFLYPNGAASLVRMLTPAFRSRQASNVQRLPRRARPFTSAVAVGSARTSHSDTSDADDRGSDYRAIVKDHELRAFHRGESERRGPDLGEEKENAEVETFAEGEELDSVEEDIDEAAADYGADAARTHSGPSFAGYGSRPDLMRELMSNTDTEYFGSIWQLFCQLEPDLQPELRPEVIAYLYKSANLLDARRVLILFADIKLSQWTPEVMTSVVNANLRLGYESEALYLYLAGLEGETPVVGGLDDFLNYGFKGEKWDIVNRVWTSYHAIFKTHGIKCGQLERLATVPDLGELVIQFAKFVKREKDDSAEALDVLLKKVARRALRQPCKPHQAIPLLRIIDQPKWYSIYLSEAIQRGQRECLAEVYNIYRSIPGTKPYWGILHGMFEIFYPDNVTGLEQVYEDYHVSYGQLDRWGFRKFLKYYAARGDVRSLERLWDNYIQAYKHRNVLEEPETFNHVTNAYASVGDHEGARRMFDKMINEYGVRPSIHSWNILLKSYVKSGDYSSALSAFDDLCEAVSPDAVSFSTIMSLAGKRGDLFKTLELLKRAWDAQIEIDSHILQAVVEAYCRNMQWSEALSTCLRAKKLQAPGDHIYLWNTLLRHHGDRRAFGAVCRVVSIMADFNIEWDSETHNVLLRALVRCRQTHHAYHLLRKARRDKSFTLTPEHFSTVMDGGLRSGELGIIHSTIRIRHHGRYPKSVTSIVREVDAMIRQHIYGKLKLRKTDSAKEVLASYIQEMLDAIWAGQAEGPDGLRASLKGADMLHRLRELLPRAIALFSRYAYFDLVKELYQLQADLGFAPPLDEKPVSVTILSALLRENVLEGQYDAAQSMWELIWEQVSRSALPVKSSNDGPLPAERYKLNSPISSMLQMFQLTENPAGLKALVNQVLRAGFKFDRRIMNTICQTLAKLGYWMEAAGLCETHLMPNFTGWQLNRMRARLQRRLPLEQRREGSAPQWLRPTSKTIVILAEDYIKTKNDAPWSAAAEEKHRLANERFPRLIAALKTLPYTGIGIELEVFGHGKTEYLHGDKK
ncbi:translation regulator [Colletotrichum musicola]|uniref:Translation regulator n=1 Tax=Colletotrichum musicola TaxID=2175873 RepID=A0A8H6NVS5_9PEZI|nr:translation regulator [Colletotrichum musicola]